jgi:hypothetical protein
MNNVRMICPLTDAEAARLADPSTMADLAERITGMPLSAPADGRGRARLVRSSRPGRRLLIGVPVAAVFAAAVLVAALIAGSGQRAGPAAKGRHANAAALLSFTRHGGYIDVIVRNPLADAKRYRAEFAKYHLDISLSLVPASPSLVGTLVYDSAPASGPQIEPITAKGKCWTGGGGDVCPVGVRVPLGFRGAATLVFGRPARPGEQYETTAPASAPGEVMHGLHYVGKTVAEVLAMLAPRHVTVNHYMVQQTQCLIVSRKTVPGNLHVESADPWEPGQVLLWVTKAGPMRFCKPVPGTPVPSPSPSASGG